MASMSYIVFPKKEQASKIVDDENWWTSDGSLVEFARFQGSSSVLYPSAIDLNYQTSTTDPNKYGWIEMKVDLDTFDEGSILMSVGTYSTASNSSRTSTNGVGISRAAFSAVGLEHGIVSVSVQSEINRRVGTGSLSSSARGVYFNGHKVTTGITTGMTTGYHGSYLFIQAPEGVDVASVVVRYEDDPDVIRRWWYVKNLELTNQVGGQDEITVNALEVNTGYTHNESNHVEMGTDYQPREGSAITAAYLDCYARHVRNSVQFGTAATRPTIGDKECRLRGTGWTEEDQAPEYRQPLTLLDVGVDTYTNVGGGIQMPTDEDLKKVGLIVNLNHVNYEGI